MFYSLSLFNNTIILIQRILLVIVIKSKNWLKQKKSANFKFALSLFISFTIRYRKKSLCSSQKYGNAN